MLYTDPCNAVSITHARRGHTHRWVVTRCSSHPPTAAPHHTQPCLSPPPSAKADTAPARIRLFPSHTHDELFRLSVKRERHRSMRKLNASSRALEVRAFFSSSSGDSSRSASGSLTRGGRRTRSMRSASCAAQRKRPRPRASGTMEKTSSAAASMSREMTPSVQTLGKALASRPSETIRVSTVQSCEVKAIASMRGSLKGVK
mmetsp:Transcript_37295/g.102943  ORF Transcript_37295/g.102943 Transcript_37295/m.102943 type:complete len:202 (-) Transcript_37295:2853-3458(-)